MRRLSTGRFADAFRRRHSPALVRLAAALTGDRRAADDVVQDVMIRMHGRWHRFDGENAALVHVRAAVVVRDLLPFGAAEQPPVERWPSPHPPAGGRPGDQPSQTGRT